MLRFLRFIWKTLFIVVFLFIFILHVPSVHDQVEGWYSLNGARDFYRAILWLKENSDRNDVILADWQIGAQIVAHAQRPTVATCKVYPSEVKEVARRYNDINKNFFAAKDEKTAMKVIRKYAVKYILFRKSEAEKDTLLYKMRRREELENLQLVYDSGRYMIYKVAYGIGIFDKDSFQAKTELITKKYESGEFSLNAAEKDYALKIARNAMVQYIKNGSILEIDKTPEKFKRNVKRLYVTLIKNGKVCGCQSDTNGTLANLIVHAAIEALRDPRFKRCTLGELDRTLIEISIIKDMSPIQTRSEEYVEKNIELGIDGLYVEGARKAFYIPSVPVMKSWSVITTLEQLCRKAGLDRNAWKKTRTMLFKFHSIDFIESSPGGKHLANFYRSNVLINTLNPEETKEAAIHAGKWLINMQKEDGSFHFMYYPHSDRIRDEEDGYITRHVFVAYSLIDLYNFTKDDRFLKAAEKAAQYLIRYIKPMPHKDIYYYVNFKNRKGTSTVALASILYFKLDKEKYRDLITGLANFLVYQQKDTGIFRQAYYKSKRHPNYEKVSDNSSWAAFYSLAFLLSHDFFDGGKYLNAAEKTAYYYMERFEKEPQPMPWAVNGLCELYFATEKKEYAMSALEIGKYIISKQYTPEGPTAAPYVDYVGGFDFFDRRYPFTVWAGKFTEALLDCHRIASDLGEEKKTFKDPILRAARFCAQMQFRDDNSFFVPNLQKAKGGFREHFNRSRERFDVASHAILTFIGATQILKASEEY